MGYQKFKPKFIGPFPIVKYIRDIAYQLELPPSILQTYPTFHVGLLKHYIPRGDGIQHNTTPALEDEGTQEHEFEKLIEEHSIIQIKKYQVWWLGYYETYNFWLTLKELKKIPEVIQAWYKQYLLFFSNKQLYIYIYNPALVARQSIQREYYKLINTMPGYCKVKQLAIVHMKDAYSYLDRRLYWQYDAIVQ